MTDNFPKYELECNCGCGTLNMNREFINQLQRARDIAGIPLPISSACRCEKHNEAEGGSPTSSHIASPDKEAYAVDIVTTSSRGRYAILTALVKAGFTRIGVAKTFIHVDSDPNKPPKVSWVY